LFADFATCFDGADAVIVAPVYGAGESPMEGGATAQDLIGAIRTSGIIHVQELADPQHLATTVDNIFPNGLQEGDMVLCLGAGTITHWAAALPAQLETLDTLSPIKKKAQ
jgi:UDP-N-acetylmuramate--alanine ligase